MLTQLLRDLDREDSSLFEWLRQTRGVAGPMHMFSVSVDDKSKEVTVYQMRSTVDQCVVSRRYSEGNDGEDVVRGQEELRTYFQDSGQNDTWTCSRVSLKSIVRNVFTWYPRTRMLTVLNS